MSVKDGKDYLYLIWKSEQTRKQYIIGQLTKNGQYEFQYSEEVQSAIADGFKPLLCFPDLNKVYKDDRLFAIFKSRLPDRKRKNIQEILEKYGGQMKMVERLPDVLAAGMGNQMYVGTFKTRREMEAFYRDVLKVRKKK